jgi:hypothetical protein
MKRILLPLLLLTIAFTSCRKWQPENKILGDWKLVDAERRRFLDNDNITTGYESGVFTFFDNGTLEYREGNLLMTGSWWMRTRNDFGNGDGNDQRNELSMRLANFQANRQLEWFFDDVNFGLSDRRMRAFIRWGSPNYRYVFERP